MEALEEDSVQRLKDEDLLRMDEKYLDSLDEDDLLVVSQKMLHALKKSHEEHEKSLEMPKKVDISEVEPDQQPVSPGAETAQSATNVSDSDTPEVSKASKGS